MQTRVAASTQDQACSAFLFPFRDVLKRSVDGLNQVVRAKRPVRVPQVLSRPEVSRTSERRLLLKAQHGGSRRGRVTSPENPPRTHPVVRRQRLFHSARRSTQPPVARSRPMT